MFNWRRYPQIGDGGEQLQMQLEPRGPQRANSGSGYSEASGVSITSSAPLSDGSIELEVNVHGHVTPEQLQNILRSFHNDRALWERIASTRYRQGGSEGGGGADDSDSSVEVTALSAARSGGSGNNIPTATPVISNAMAVVEEEEDLSNSEPEGQQKDDKEWVVVSQEEDGDDEDEIRSQRDASLRTPSHQRTVGSCGRRTEDSRPSFLEQESCMEGPSRISLHRNMSGAGSLKDDVWQPSGESVISRTSQGVAGGAISVSSIRSFRTRYNSNTDFRHAFTVVADSGEHQELSLALSAISSPPLSLPQNVVVPTVEEQKQELQLFYPAGSQNDNLPSELTSAQQRRVERKRPNLYCVTNLILLLMASVLLGAIIGLSLPVTAPNSLESTTTPSPSPQQPHSSPTTSPSDAPLPLPTSAAPGKKLTEAPRKGLVPLTTFDIHLTVLSQAGENAPQGYSEDLTHHCQLQSELPDVGSNHWLPLTHAVSKFLLFHVRSHLQPSRKQVFLDDVVLSPVKLTVSNTTRERDSQDVRRRTVIARNSSFQIGTHYDAAFGFSPRRAAPTCNVSFRYEGKALFRLFLRSHQKDSIPSEQTLSQMQKETLAKEEELLQEIQNAMSDNFSPSLEVTRVTTDLVKSEEATKAKGEPLEDEKTIAGRQQSDAGGGGHSGESSRSLFGIVTFVAACVAILSLLVMSIARVLKSRQRTGAFHSLRGAP